MAGLSTSSSPSLPATALAGAGPADGNSEMAGGGECRGTKTWDHREILIPHPQE